MNEIPDTLQYLNDLLRLNAKDLKLYKQPPVDDMGTWHLAWDCYKGDRRFAGRSVVHRFDPQPEDSMRVSLYRGFTWELLLDTKPERGYIQRATWLYWKVWHLKQQVERWKRWLWTLVPQRWRPQRRRLPADE